MDFRAWSMGILLSPSTWLNSPLENRAWSTFKTRSLNRIYGNAAWICAELQGIK